MNKVIIEIAYLTDNDLWSAIRAIVNKTAPMPSSYNPEPSSTYTDEHDRERYTIKTRRGN